MAEAIVTVLDGFADADSEGVAIVALEQGRMAIDEEYLEDVLEHFQWYRRGIGL